MLNDSQLEDFLRDHWTRKPFLTAISDADFCSLKEEFGGFDGRELMRNHKGEVASVWFENKQGHAQAVDMSPTDALKFYEGGMTVFLPDVKTPTIERWHGRLARSLNRAPNNFLSSLFLSNGGNISGCHFDHLESFTVQLKGSKTWRLAENLHVQLPTVNYSAHTPRPYLEDFRLYSTRPLPRQMVTGAEQVTVAPGSMLYVPRGYWHEVEATTDSISLLLAFPVCTWLDLILPSLRTMLLSRTGWRENAIYPHDAESWRRAHNQLKGLCRELAAFLERVDPAEFLPHASELERDPAHSKAVFLRNKLCTLGMYEAGSDRMDLVASVHQGDLSRTREVQVPASWTPVLETIDQNSRFTEADLAEKHPELAPDLPRLLEVLLAVELIRLADVVADVEWKAKSSDAA